MSDVPIAGISSDQPLVSRCRKDSRLMASAFHVSSGLYQPWQRKFPAARSSHSYRRVTLTVAA